MNSKGRVGTVCLGHRFSFMALIIGYRKAAREIASSWEEPHLFILPSHLSNQIVHLPPSASAFIHLVSMFLWSLVVSRVTINRVCQSISEKPLLLVHSSPSVVVGVRNSGIRDEKPALCLRLKSGNIQKKDQEQRMRVRARQGLRITLQLCLVVWVCNSSFSDLGRRIASSRPAYAA